MSAPARRLAVVTGASSGIGAATATALVAAGFSVLLGARRVARLEALATRLGPAANTAPLDVTDTASVAAFCAGVEHCSLPVNNAGGALGLAKAAEADEDDWRTMYETNVLGVARMTKALLPALRASGDALVVTIGSIAAFERYAGAAGYNAAQAGARAGAHPREVVRDLRHRDRHDLQRARELDQRVAAPLRLEGIGRSIDGEAGRVS